MCGINGIFAYGPAAAPVEAAELLRTRDHMAARGPDGFGAWVSDDGKVGLGHRRLSIIDLSEAGAQPMHSGDGNLAVTFNGEIYNHVELRRDLEANGHVFKSHSDTEVLLHLYAARGAAMVHDLRGMFAFAIWDNAARTLFLARDPYGIKPLYYADDGATFRFASQVKALRAGGKIEGAPSPAGAVGFLIFGSVPEPYTIWAGIKALPAGTIMTITPAGASRPRRYHSLANVYNRAEAGGSRAFPDVRAALLDSVRHHLVADVPVGAFLSGGIDSGALVGLMRDAGQSEILTVTLSFGEFENGLDDEAPLAEHAARLYGTAHTTRVVTEAEFAAELPAIFDAMDQPSIDGVNTWFVSKAARELGLKVAISGVGGDELFGGYPSFCEVPRWARLFRPFGRVAPLGRGLRAVSRDFVVAAGKSPKLAGMAEYASSFEGAYLLKRAVYMPWELSALIEPSLLQEGLAELSPVTHLAEGLEPRPKSDFAKVAILESAFYMRNQLLRDTDWASMAHSLEVRVPLVDAALLREVALRIQSPDPRVPKLLLARAPKTPLPDAIIHRPKTGFSVPLWRWMEKAQARARPPKSRVAEPGKGETLRAWSRLIYSMLPVSASV
jgi:asparagine synthase (glutamine-hydrolysing)